jgi:small conductance mechanosensitive channel
MLETYLPKIKEFILTYGVKVLGALAVLIIGWIVIKWVTKFIGKMIDRKGIDVSLKPFLMSLTSALLKVLLLISVAGMMGIETTSFIAIIGAAGLAIGLALQGTLANFAGGVLILILKPFRVGDLIEANGHIGVVTEIQIFVTKLTDPQNRLVIIPNGVLSNSDIRNYTELGRVRVDLTIGIAYGADLKKAKEVLMGVMQNHQKVLKDPAPFVGVAELADSSVNLAVRPHCKPEDYWEVFFDIYENGKLALDAAKVSIPFPQMDVHIKKDL